MKQTRYGFETNSSSTHSLVVSGIRQQSVWNDGTERVEFKASRELNPIALLGELQNDGTFIISGNIAFGWGIELWNFPADKATYLMLDEESEIKCGTPKTIEFRERLRKLIAKKSGAEGVTFLGIDEVSDKNSEVFGSYNAYIDHQSLGCSVPLRELDDDALWNWLLDPSCGIQGGNDNCTDWESPWE